MIEFPGAAFHLVEVAVGQAVRIEELAVLLLDAEVEPLEVVVVLVARAIRLAGPLDDAEVDELRVLGRHAGKLKQAEANALKQPLLAAAAEIPCWMTEEKLSFFHFWSYYRP